MTPSRIGSTSYSDLVTGQVWERRNWWGRRTQVEVLGVKCFWWRDLDGVVGEIGLPRVAIKQGGVLKIISDREWSIWSRRATLVSERPTP